MSDIKPIETWYANKRFRSKLEARWAVFFDALGIQWRYEPQGFEINSHEVDELNNPVRKWAYLPDFYLPVEQCWVEVKGDTATLDAEMLTNAVDYGSQMPHVGNSFGTTRGIVLLSDVPSPPQLGPIWRQWESELICHPILQHSKGVLISGAAFGVDGIRQGEDAMRKSHTVKTRMGIVASSFPGWISGSACCEPFVAGEFWACEQIPHWQWVYESRAGCDLYRAAQKQQDAYRRARSVRFEFGETPRPPR